MLDIQISYPRISFLIQICSEISNDYQLLVARSEAASNRWIWWNNDWIISVCVCTNLSRLPTTIKCSQFNPRKMTDYYVADAKWENSNLSNIITFNKMAWYSIIVFCHYSLFHLCTRNVVMLPFTAAIWYLMLVRVCASTLMCCCDSMPQIA